MLILIKQEEELTLEFIDVHSFIKFEKYVFEVWERLFRVIFDKIVLKNKAIYSMNDNLEKLRKSF